MQIHFNFFARSKLVRLHSIQDRTYGTTSRATWLWWEPPSSLSLIRPLMPSTATLCLVALYCDGLFGCSSAGLPGEHLLKSSHLWSPLFLEIVRRSGLSPQWKPSRARPSLPSLRSYRHRTSLSPYLSSNYRLSGWDSRETVQLMSRGSLVDVVAAVHLSMTSPTAARAQKRRRGVGLACRCSRFIFF